MRKLLPRYLISLLFAFIISLPAYCDSIISPSGTIIKGKLHTVVGGLILIKTEDGMKSVTRQVGVGKARDIIEVGMFRKKKIVGRVLYKDEDIVEVRTADGVLSIKSYKVKNIILAQDFNATF